MPLVLAANRDEFFARPAAPAGFWPDAPQVLAGRDESAGGTWLGITRTGRFAALTNVRDPAQMRSDRPSRGALVADYLSGAMSPVAYLDALVARGAAYNGFNLLVGRLGEAPEMHCYCNVDGSRRELPPGLHGLSNHQLDTGWPKVRAAKAALHDAMADGAPDDALLALLASEARHADDDLPQTGVPLVWERALSAAHIRTPAYGTRCATLVKWHAAGRLQLDEQTWLPHPLRAERGTRRRYVLPLLREA